MLIVVLVAVLGVDVMRLGFFADDFHFLDVARRVPLWKAVSGSFGIWPWYRPLSRELFFAAVVCAGPAGLLLAHLASLTCLALTAWQIRAIGQCVAHGRAAAVGAILFLSGGIVRFLSGWPSGFQDLLATLFVLLAVRSQLDRRRLRALAWAFLAMFAKETAAIGPLLLVVAEWLRNDGRRLRSVFFGSTIILAAASALHLLVRTTWGQTPPIPTVEQSVGGLASALTGMLASLVGVRPKASIQVLLLALFGAGSAWALVRGSSGEVRAGSGPNRDAGGGYLDPQRSIVFLLVASAIGTTPLIVGSSLALVHAETYYAYSALPWLCLLIGVLLSRLPGNVPAWVVSAILAWNTSAFAYRAVDLSSAEAWKFRQWDWPEAVRLSAVTSRIQEDLRTTLAERPDSLVVLLSGFENGCFFQTEDGPAVRETLRDPGLRAYWLYSAPPGLRPGQFEILAFNRDTHHLECNRLPIVVRSELATNALAEGHSTAAWALASYGDSLESTQLPLVYARMSAAILEHRSEDALEELALIGLGDTLADSARARVVRELGPDSPLARPLELALRRPLDAGVHVAFAEALRRSGYLSMEASERRLAVTLNPRLTEERVRMNVALLRLGRTEVAIADLSDLAEHQSGTGSGQAARALLRTLPASQLR